MTQNSGKFCEYHYCDGNHQRTLPKSIKSEESIKYLRMALNNSTNNRIMQEKLKIFRHKCQEKMMDCKKNSVNKKLKHLPELCEIREENENKDNCDKNFEFSSISSELLKEMFLLQNDIKIMLRKYY